MLQRKQPDKSPKALALMVSLLLLLCVTVSGTAAFLMDNAGSIENIFKPSRVTTSVTETLTNGVKSNVKITNTGDTDAYIRAAVVATWRDAEGNLYGRAPVARADYEITFNTVFQGKANAWIQSSDGFYYWTSSVKQNQSTGVLIASCSPRAGRTPEGYTLYVEVIASGIQSRPASVVTREWDGVTGVTGDTLTIRQGG